MAGVSEDNARPVAKALRALAHPARLRALSHATEGEKLSASKLRAEMPDVALQTLSYHVRCLADAGYLQTVGQVPSRGGVEHLYLITPRGIKLVAALGALADLIALID